MMTDNKSGNNPFTNPNASPPHVFTIEQIRALQQQVQQQQEVQQQSSSSNSSNPSSQRPFMVLTQVPVTATPFASQQQSSNNASLPNGMQNWTQLLQPQPNPMPTKYSPGNVSALSPQLPNTNNNTNQALQQLMQNALSAQYQQQQKSGHNNIANNRQNMLSSKVEPVERDPWKSFMMDEMDTGSSGNAGMKAVGAKRKHDDYTQSSQQPQAMMYNDDNDNESDIGADSTGMEDLGLDDVAPTPLSEMQAKSYQSMNSSHQYTSHNTASLTAQYQNQLHQLQQNPSIHYQQNTATTQQQQAIPSAPSSMYMQQNYSQSVQNPSKQQQYASHSYEQVRSMGDQPLNRKSLEQPLTPIQPTPTVTTTQSFLLPSTMMPPSVLTSVMPPSSKKATTKYKKRSNTKSSRMESPQDALWRLLSQQEYQNVSRIKAEDAAYDTMPSALQLASFGTELVKAIHTSDVDLLSSLLSCGLSPNPCNQFRDSIVDLVCKRANTSIFSCLVEHGCDLRVCDGFGRTPLHHCCWASEFSPDICDAILSQDIMQLFIEDKRGQTPLEYVRDEQALDWIDYLEDNMERYFPRGGTLPSLQNVKDLRPEGCLPDPPNALPVPLAAAVSSGKISPEDVARMDPDTKARYQ